ncbi:MAG: ribonuclease H-like domain-containing protein [Caldimicrobium sp.]|nr:ribonuclease H-like domain-containing protein [Caldimicrobium sp.]MCX7872955.1 ribonuclease H-like domain-containing protein [Caldimicrobium sp.]MDW8094573.1 ribonuclease H-like domain-containing protein [Caldimicrobium sp.]
MEDKLRLLELYLKTPDQALFLDIETEGLSKEKNGITLIGLYLRGQYRAFIQGIDLEKALEYLTTTPIWITFGGENFDIPFIKKTFHEGVTPLVHLDLYHLSRLIGLRGGLKEIERTLGLRRQTEGLNGYDAVKLWRKWKENGDYYALQRLIQYNQEDVVNLEVILNYIIRKLFGEAVNT